MTDSPYALTTDNPKRDDEGIHHSFIKMLETQQIIIHE